MQCPKCSYQNPPGAKFCLECGHRLVNTQSTADSVNCCPRCHAPLQPGMVFCASCGGPVVSHGYQSAVPKRVTQITSISTETGKTIICPNCSQEVDASLSICPHCHSNLQTEFPVIPDVEQQQPASGTRRCPGCGAVLGENEVFCTSCGFSFTAKESPVNRIRNTHHVKAAYRSVPASEVNSVTYCPACGSVNQSGDRFCFSCGMPLHQQGTGSKYISACSTSDSVGYGSSVYNGAFSRSTSPSYSRSSHSLALILVPVLSGAFLLVSMISWGFMVHSAQSPEKTARTYMTLLCNGEYEKAYQMLDLPKSQYLTPEIFRSVNQQMDLGNTTSITLRKEGESSVGTGSALIHTEEYEAVLGQSDDQAPKTEKITVEKSDRKHHLFFNQWTISDSDLIAHQVRLQILADCVVLIDGIEPDVSMKQDSDDETMALYVIPEMFCTEYEIELQRPDHEPVVMNLSVDENYQIIDLMNSENPEAAAQLQKQAVQDLESIYQAAINGSSFETVSGLFADSRKRGIEEGYQLLQKSLSAAADPVSLKLSNIQAVSRPASGTVRLVYYCSAQFVLRSGSDDDSEEYSRTGSREVSMSYIRQNGKWKLENLPDLMLFQ